MGVELIYYFTSDTSVSKDSPHCLCWAEAQLAAILLANVAGSAQYTLLDDLPCCFYFLRLLCHPSLWT